MPAADCTQPADALPAIEPSLAQHLVQGLFDTLAPQFGDTPEKQAIRNAAILAALQALAPGDPVEAMLAVQALAAHHGVMRALSRAMHDNNGHGSPRGDRAQRNAASLMRTFLAMVKMLRGMQAARQRQDRAEQDSPVPSGAPARPAPQPRTPTARPATEPARTPAWEELTEAEHFAVNHPRQAAALRATGGDPRAAGLGPIPPELARAVAGGTGPIFAALDAAVAAEKAYAT